MVGFTGKFSVSLMNYINNTNEPLQVIKLYDFQIYQHHQLWSSNMETFINYALRELLAYPLIDNDFRPLEVFRFLRDTFSFIMSVQLDETIDNLIGNHYIPSDIWPVNQENFTYISQTQEMIADFFQLEQTQNIAFVFTFEDSWMFNDDNRVEKVILKHNDPIDVLEQVMQQYGILSNINIDVITDDNLFDVVIN